MKKRLLSGLLAAALVISMLPSAVLAIDTNDEKATVLAALDIMAGDENGDLNLGQSVTRAEFQAAGAQGLKPSMVVKVHDVDYHGEQLVEVGGVRYSVYRDYHKGETRELYVTQKGGDTDEN